MADAPRRVNFFDGMRLTAADLAVEQQYHREMRYLHNRLHGYGTVSGLEVTASRATVHVGPGLALDPCGREIVLTEPLTLGLEPPLHDRRWLRDLVITWHEDPEAQAPASGGVVDHTRWVERPELSLVPAGKGPPDGLVLARLLRQPRGPVDVDTSVRRLLGPAGTGGGAGAGAS
jgi:hypothetical protein